MVQVLHEHATYSVNAAGPITSRNYSIDENSFDRYLFVCPTFVWAPLYAENLIVDVKRWCNGIVHRIDGTLSIHGKGDKFEWDTESVQALLVSANTSTEQHFVGRDEVTQAMIV